MPRPRNTAPCAVGGCTHPVKTRGWCQMHYFRWRRHGDPTATDTPWVGTPIAVRLESRLDKSGGPDSCWEYQGARHHFGYGDLRQGRRLVRAHRLAWEIAHGPIPAGMFVCHKCDNPPCCNETHLFLGTNADNIADMIAKGRGRHGPGRPATAEGGEP